MTDHDAYGQSVGAPVPDWTPPPAPVREPIKGTHVRLEPLSVAAHADALYARHVADADPASWSWLGYGPFDSARDYRDWIHTMTADADPMLYAIVDRNAPERGPVGVAAYLRIKPVEGTIEIGHIHFTHALRRTPAATEAIARLIGHAFSLGYRRVEWKCHAMNTASQAAARRFGFTFEGIFRQHRVVKGRNRDTAWFSIIDAEWPARREAFAAWLAPDNFDADGQQRRALAAWMPDTGANT